MYIVIVRMYNPMYSMGYKDYKFVTEKDKKELLSVLKKKYGERVEILYSEDVEYI